MPKECDENMERFKDECERKRKLKEKLDEDIKNINNIQKEIGTILDWYGGKEEDFENRKIENDKYSKKWTPVIEAAIKNKKADLDKKIKEYDDQITNIEKEIPLLEKAKNEATKQFRTSQIQRDIEKDAYEDKKKNIEDDYKENGKIDKNLKNLDDWKKKIEEDYENDKLTMYGWISEFNRVLIETTIKRIKELESDLYDSWKKANNAEKDCREKYEQVEIAKNKLENKKKDLEDLKEKRKDKILQITSENGQQGKAGKKETGNLPEEPPREPKRLEIS